MYAIIVGTPSGFLIDSLHEEKSFVESEWADGLMLPSFLDRVSQMSRMWVTEGKYFHPQELNPETEQVLGYAPQGGTASSVLTQLEDGFFVFVCRENRHGEIHFWNLRYSGVWEFNWRGSPELLNIDSSMERLKASWYVRTLNLPSSLETYVWDHEWFQQGPNGQREFAFDAGRVGRCLPTRSREAKAKNLIPNALFVDQKTLKCGLKPAMLWSRKHLEALRSTDLELWYKRNGVSKPCKG